MTAPLGPPVAVWYLIGGSRVAPGSLLRLWLLPRWYMPRRKCKRPNQRPIKREEHNIYLAIPRPRRLAFRRFHQVCGGINIPNTFICGGCKRTNDIARSWWLVEVSRIPTPVSHFVNNGSRLVDRDVLLRFAIGRGRPCHQYRATRPLCGRRSGMLH